MNLSNKQILNAAASMMEGEAEDAPFPNPEWEHRSCYGFLSQLEDDEGRPLDPDDQDAEALAAMMSAEWILWDSDRVQVRPATRAEVIEALRRDEFELHYTPEGPSRGFVMAEEVTP